MNHHHTLKDCSPATAELAVRAMNETWQIDRERHEFHIRSAIFDMAENFSRRDARDAVAKALAELEGRA